MEADIGSVVMLVVGIAILIAAFLLLKNRLTKKPRDQRRDELYADYEEKMKEFKK